MWQARLVCLASIVAICSSFEPRRPTTQTPIANCDASPNCDYDACVLPECKCSGDLPTLEREKRPQIVYLTYDDAFTAIAEKNFYSPIYTNESTRLTNPDGRTIRATHFLTASYTDYVLVNKYWREFGHEVASHSISHRTDLDYWRGINADGWEAEASGMKKMISSMARIPKEDIKGFRAPFLQMGGDEMYTALSKDFLYDCSWTSRDFGYQHLDDGLYPYTMDYASIQDCEIEPCPQCSYENFWVQPMLDLEDNWFDSNPLHPDWGQPCSMLDGCIFIDEQTPEAVTEMLQRNFNKTYEGSRAPFGLYMHAAWFFGEQTWHYDGYYNFLKWVTENYNDVWFVTISEGLDYFQHFSSSTNDDLLDMTDGSSPFDPSKRIEDRKQYACEGLEPCRYMFNHPPDVNQDEERYMHICDKTVEGRSQRCPREYPWLENPCGGNTPC
eukprot:TRINITY_DN5766_c0_g2_i1.p1 TRINITY_DN5766_c0_g2~~TRINITY_DN5766_c0_g2_i1.p1  ORF type:complete len:442 (+),score=66.46 TRINITY_DN5766_c0_g2_i1:38-1363(+)